VNSKDQTVTGAAIGAGAGAVVAGPAGAVVGGVGGAVIGGPHLPKTRVASVRRHRVYWTDKSGHRHWHWAG
jgi:hypothetical protein